MRSRCYASDLTDAQWALVGPHIRSAKSSAVVRVQRTSAPSSTRSSICSAPVASGVNFPTTSRPGRPYTPISEAGV